MQNYLRKIYLPMLLVFISIVIGVTKAGAQEVPRIGTYEISRALKPYNRVPNAGAGKTEVIGKRELNAQRMKEILSSKKILVVDKSGEAFKRKVMKMNSEGDYQSNRGKVNFQPPSKDRIPVLKNNSSIEKYSPALSEGNIGLNNLTAIGNLTPAEWGKIKIVEGLRTPKPDVSWKAFDAIDDCSGDVSLGVSETHVVVTSRTHIGYYDRAGNKLGEVTEVEKLFDWTMPLTGVNMFYDTRSIYDPFRKRFWIAALGRHSDYSATNLKPGIFCVAVSKTQNPLDGFYTYYWYSGYEVNQDNDYPAIGINEDVLIATNTAKKGIVSYSNICIFDANSLAAGEFKPGWRFWDWTNPLNNQLADFHIQPVLHHGSSPYAYLVGKQGNNIIVYGIKDALKPSQSVSSWVLDFSGSPFTPTTAAPQKGSEKTLWYQNLSNWIFSATWRNNNLYFIMSDAKDWQGIGDPQTSLRLVRVKTEGTNYWYDINRVFGGSNKFDDKPTDKIYYGFPAIAVNKKGDMITGYTRSGSTIYPEIRVSAWRNDGVDILPSRLIKAGEAPYKVTLDNWKPEDPWPWADCSGAVVDPVDDHSVWIATSYTTTATNNNWGIWVARIKMW